MEVKQEKLFKVRPDRKSKHVPLEEDIEEVTVDKLKNSPAASLNDLDAKKTQGKSEEKPWAGAKMNILILSISILLLAIIMLIFGLSPRVPPQDGPGPLPPTIIEVPVRQNWGYVDIDSYKTALERLGGSENLAELKGTFPKNLELTNYGLVYEGLFKPNLELARNSGLKIQEEDLVELLMMRVYLHNDGQLQIKIIDPINQRWEIPEEYPYPYTYKETDPEIIAETQKKMPKVNIQVDLRSESLSVEVKRKETDQVIFKLNSQMIYSNYYINYQIELSSRQLYGFGERTSALQYQPGTYSLYSIDRGSEIDHGEIGKNKHGHHPMYINKEPSGLYHLMYFRNSNYQELTITRDNKISWITIGGIIDLNIFLGNEKPEEIVKTYHRYIGGWQIPALWHLGYHQSKYWSYMSVPALEEVLNKFEEINCPMDVLWSDVEYFKPGYNLVFNKELYNPGEMQDMFIRHNKRWIAIADAVVPKDEKYGDEMRPDYKDFVVMDNIKDRKCDAFYLGHESYMLDFLQPNITDFWYYAFDQVYKNVKFSGLWIDSNEMTTEEPDSITDPKLHSKYRNIPYFPGGVSLYKQRVVNPECIHADGTEEYDVKSLTTIKQAEVTNKYLTRRHAFPFVLSRATAVGGAKYSYHWIPDMLSRWDKLKDSFGSVLSAGLFGYTMTGTEICGFLGKEQINPELCMRWHQLGIFHGFMRNHHMPKNGKADNSQEPYAFEGEYRDGIVNALRLRYKLMKWMLTMYLEKGYIRNIASDFEAKGVGVIQKPLFFTFYNHDNLPEYGSDVYESQFMFGDGVMIAPAFYQGVYDQSVFFPRGVWTDLRFNSVIRSSGEFIKVQCRINQNTPFFLYEGNMVFFNEDDKALASDEMNNNFRFVFSLNQEGESKGNFMNIADFSEDNVNSRCIDSQCLGVFKANLNQDTKKICLSFSDQKGEKLFVNKQLLVDKMSIISGYVNIPEDSKLTIESDHMDLLQPYNLSAEWESDGDRVNIVLDQAVPLYLLDGICIAI